jgi:hypothetical protein
MDRFTWYQAGESMNEDLLIQAGNVGIYDGDQKAVGCLISYIYGYIYCRQLSIKELHR